MNRITLTTLALLSVLVSSASAKHTQELSPSPGAKEINPDTHLTILFAGKPTLGHHGFIRVYNNKTNELVDMLDISIPAGPVKAVEHGKNILPYSPEPYSYSSTNFTNRTIKAGTPSGRAAVNSDTFQLNIIGRFTDAFHFYPVIIHENKATIYLHNNILDYNESYYITIDSTVFSFDRKPTVFKGIYTKNWVFATKRNQPSMKKDTLIVDASGKGDFNTVQGAVDFLPDYGQKRVTIFIRKGEYEEIVYFRNKSNITFCGEGRDKTKVFYANNEVFNPHPSNLSTNEWPGTFPSRRAAFTCDNSTDIRFENFCIATTAKGQAEGLLINGHRNSLKNMHIIGSGDAIQCNGSVYAENCLIEGDGDTYLGRGPSFFNQCHIRSVGTLMWVRNTSANHGVVLKECILECTHPNVETEIARAPDNKGNSYPWCEVVLLNCRLSGISPVGWGAQSMNTEHVRLLEYNSTELSTGKPIDTSRRHPASRQLRMPSDSVLIKNYTLSEYVLDGWRISNHAK